MEELLISVCRLIIDSVIFYLGYQVGKRAVGVQKPLPPIVLPSNSLLPPTPIPDEKLQITGQQMANTDRYKIPDGARRFINKQGQFIQQKKPKEDKKK